MDQNIDNRHKEILWDLLANPAENGRLYKHNLEQLVQDNPQSGLLQVMYARATQTPDVRKASAYFSPKALYKILHDPDGLLPVARDRVNKARNGSQPAEPENYFNIGAVTEAETIEAISDAPVAENESLVTQEDTQPVKNIIPTEVYVPETEEEHLLAQYQEETAVATPAEEPAEETQQPTPADTAPAEPDHYQAPQPDDYHTPVTAPPTEPAHDAAPSHDEADEEDAFDNPWDLSKLVEPNEMPVEEEVAGTLAEAEKTPDTQPAAAAEPVAAPVPEEPYIETYDHSLSAYEQQAIEPAAAEEEVSSFESYRPENFFHKQGDIEDEVYDEIVSIDEIGVETVSNKFAADIHPDEIEVEATGADEEAANAQQSYIDDETEKLIYGNIAATDYLSFDKKLDELRAATPPVAAQQPATEATAAPIAPLPAALPQPVAQQQLAEGAKDADVISKYNDDTLPYSFMWWLDKTRKEYAGVNQPYATPEHPAAPLAAQGDAAKKPASDELQQQYYANIFSLTSVSGIGEIEPAQIAFDPAKKEDIIIERFIHTDPQIKPLSADKLDNENKAKKSSEDQDALVTETLARIYGDQMLYHKAIATYKKLMLKIPEKKLYFAAQIEQLEKKIN
nr:hypothetical protein [uncultured Mucilaginibacter sp.]